MTSATSPWNEIYRIVRGKRKRHTNNYIKKIGWNSNSGPT